MGLFFVKGDGEGEKHCGGGIRIECCKQELTTSTVVLSSDDKIIFCIFTCNFQNSIAIFRFSMKNASK